MANAVLRDSLLPLLGPHTALFGIGGRPAIELSFREADLVLDGALGTDYLLRGRITLDLRGEWP